MSDIIIGVERTLTDIGPLAKWNKKRLRWIITHNTPNHTRQHIIDLQMVIVSSQRVIIVDGKIKLKAMVNFGLNQTFQISQKLQGRIQQDTLTFQLYVNGLSFTELSKKQYGYQPPKLQINFSQSQETFAKIWNKNKPPSNPFNNKEKPILIGPKKQTKIIPQNTHNMNNSYNKNIVIKQPQKIEDALKSTKDEVMRIMIQQKRRKKQLQLMQNQLNNS